MVSHGNQPSTQSEVKGQPFELRAVFKYNDSLVQVSNPRVSLVSPDNGQIVAFQALDALPLSSDRTEWALNLSTTLTSTYVITVDPLSLPTGIYQVVFRGEISTGTTEFTQEIKGVIGVNALSRGDRIVNMARELLLDYGDEYLFRENVPVLKSSTLFKYMENAIQAFNIGGTPMTDYDISTLPANTDSIIVSIIVAEALFARARVAIENDVTINDSRSITTDLYGKYQSMYQQKKKEADENIKTFKAMTRPSPFGFKRARYPYYAARVIGLMPMYQNVFLPGTVGRPY